jgi:YebC/PmpR family DNA-binding regulatory protein
MAGHSKFSNIKHRKGAQDAKRAKLFTKLQKEVTVAAKIGNPDPEFNPRLRNAIITAKSQNMPKDRIDGAIKKAMSTTDGDNFEEIRYEGYGPNGVAVIVESLTDNKNRTASSVRSIFSKSGGSLGETGSVNFMFEHLGVIEYGIEVASEDDMFEIAIEVGASDVESSEESHHISCELESFSKVRDALIAKFGDPLSARICWISKDQVEVSEEVMEKVTKLIDNLEDDDDVQNIFTNI